MAAKKKTTKPKKPATKMTPTKKTPTKKTPTKKTASTGTKKAATRMAPRKDLGAPIDGFFQKQPATLRPIVDALRALVTAAAPEATSSLKWGMPFFVVGREMVCAIAAFKAHVNLILPGPLGTYPDPDGLLEGDGKTGRHLKVHAGDAVPRAAVARWLAIAVGRARSGPT